MRCPWFTSDCRGEHAWLSQRMCKREVSGSRIGGASGRGHVEEQGRVDKLPTHRTTQRQALRAERSETAKANLCPCLPSHSLEPGRNGDGDSWKLTTTDTREDQTASGSCHPTHMTLSGRDTGPTAPWWGVSVLPFLLSSRMLAAPLECAIRFRSRQFNPHQQTLPFLTPPNKSKARSGAVDRRGKLARRAVLITEDELGEARTPVSTPSRCDSTTSPA
jgi:hypothetical protein